MNPKPIKQIDPIRADDRIVILRIDLFGATSRIWRRVEVPCSFSLDDLHRVIQIAMGWEDMHLHSFIVGRQSYSPHSEDDDLDLVGDDTRAVTLESLELYKKGTRFAYEYDFGDSWMHQIEVESVVARKASIDYPRCTKAVRACPPEDSGGIHHYLRILRILKNPRHSEYEDIRDWVGDEFDPKFEDLEEINEHLKRAFAV